MTPTSLALLLALPLLWIFKLQAANSRRIDFLDPRDALRYVKDNDNCNRRRFRSKTVSETRRKAHNDCVFAYENFWDLSEEERNKSCPDPQDPACRWFYRQEIGFFQSCSFMCERQPLEFSCLGGPRRVPLAQIVSLIGVGNTIPIEFSYPEPPPQYRPPPSAAGPKPTPKPSAPVRVKSDVDQKAELFIKQFHEKMEAKARKARRL